MKSTSKEKIMDPIAEAKKNKRFNEYSLDSKMRLNFGIEVYNRRKGLGWSQQKLANKIKSFQKVISNIENGAVDIQSSTINRLNAVLKFSPQSWSKIYDFEISECKMFFIKSSAENTNKPLLEYKQIKDTTVSAQVF